MHPSEESRKRPEIIRRQSSKQKLRRDQQRARISRPGSGAYLHSYDNHFSTTALPNLLRSGTQSRDEGHQSHGGHTELSFPELASKLFKATGEMGDARSQSYQTLNSHLMVRTGSRLWEETRESKGQSWLGTRASSTKLYDSESDSEEQEGNDTLSDPSTRQRQAKFMVGDDEESDEEDNYYHFDDEEEMIDSSDLISRSRMLSFMDWLLGISDDNQVGLKETFDQTTKPLTKEEKIRRREEEAKKGRIDVAFILGMLAGMG